MSTQHNSLQERIE